jgi:predicted RNA-binding protein with PUA-like domain
MNYWLLKSEAEMFSIDDFKKDKSTIWTEVRNYQARNYMRDGMKPGDLFLFHHSSSDPSGVAGTGKILKTGIGDPTALDKKSEYYDAKASRDNNPWITVEVGFGKKFARFVSLDDIRANKKLKDMGVIRRGNRLSVQPVTKAEFEEILRMGQ